MRKGFTLLEVLTVVIIVAILASLAVPQFFRVAERARAAEGVQILGAVRSAQMRHMAEHGAGADGDYADVQDDLDMTITDAKYFDLDNMELVGFNESTDDDEVIATISRNSESYGYEDAYELSITKDGEISCGGNDDVCTRLGY